MSTTQNSLFICSTTLFLRNNYVSQILVLHAFALFGVAYGPTPHRKPRVTLDIIGNISRQKVADS